MVTLTPSRPLMQYEHWAASVPVSCGRTMIMVAFLSSGGVRCWHETDMPTASINVRFQGQSGKHMLAASISPFDLGRVKTCAHEERAELFSLLSCLDNRRQRFCFPN